MPATLLKRQLCTSGRAFNQTGGTINKCTFSDTEEGTQEKEEAKQKRTVVDLRSKRHGDREDVSSLFTAELCSPSSRSAYMMENTPRVEFLNYSLALWIRKCIRHK